jgi:hypothetical protein
MNEQGQDAKSVAALLLALRVLDDNRVVGEENVGA